MAANKLFFLKNYLQYKKKITNKLSPDIINKYMPVISYE